MGVKTHSGRAYSTKSKSLLSISDQVQVLETRGHCAYFLPQTHPCENLCSHSLTSTCFGGETHPQKSLGRRPTELRPPHTSTQFHFRRVGHTVRGRHLLSIWLCTYQSMPSLAHNPLKTCQHHKCVVGQTHTQRWTCSLLILDILSSTIHAKCQN